MNLCKDQESLPLYVNSSNAGPYTSSIASSASSSVASVWSDACSQASDDTAAASSTSADSVWSDALSQSSDDTSSGISDESENDCCYVNNNNNNHHHSCEPVLDGCEQSARTAISYQRKNSCTELPPQLGRNPRRTSIGPSTRTGGPPTLVNQEDRKIKFVDNLVDSSAQIVEAIWPISSPPCRADMGARGVLPLRTFIQETLRRSRTSYYTLQVALYYLVLVKPQVPARDFTMEQPDNTLTSRALQCGRRMFLAALILASKYLQDRNYSARAWSKISGLNTAEINQNEMAFLKAVNFRLHITDTIFQRWTDIVLRYTPNEGPDPEAPSKRATPEQAECWKSIVLKLDPDLSNVAGIEPSATRPTVVGTGSAEPYLETSYTFGSNSNESTPTTKYFAPNVLEPCPSTTFAPGRPAPALGLLPTPRMTPQSTGFGTPAASATPFSSGRSSMCYAMAQASNAYASSTQDKWPAHALSSPLSCTFPRRSSLANSVSSVSSPESMVSDISSRSSRSSSISSASSLMSAPITYKLDVQARCRYAKRCNNERNLRTTMAPVAEGTPDFTPTTSPDSYTGPVGKELLGLSLDTPLSKHQSADYFSKDPVHSAARALQDLHNYPRTSCNSGLKRSRTESVSQSLQENVREMLLASTPTSSHGTGWPESLVRDPKGPKTAGSSDCCTQIAMPSPCNGLLGRKRMCCEPQSFCRPELVALPTSGAPGMWTGILN